MEARVLAERILEVCAQRGLILLTAGTVRGDLKNVANRARIHDKVTESLPE